jgi:hypothetical protein
MAKINKEIDEFSTRKYLPERKPLNVFEISNAEATAIRNVSTTPIHGGSASHDKPKLHEGLEEKRTHPEGDHVVRRHKHMGQKESERLNKEANRVPPVMEGQGYSKSAVDKQIKKDKRIGGKEAKMIHALLKGRQKTDEPEKK